MKKGRQWGGTGGTEGAGGDPATRGTSAVVEYIEKN